ncbi:D-alanyl-D-alanine carboxypeptidase [Alkalihalophilus pseudofirmus OF4]|uniref:D-alanyl-D-alanine carboxypeptidase n=1 Tax=Alkalihalophilus pseudofirmus (strain ATCC BAA-2126 / JCM 17055 / OF4) TaxID=398511 RepID=D3FZK2_ALKPO|nr:stalk domain-containing protein [Alkalihalophilus pseudofirmus]ADC49244.1 D-alanyl-D-alanine carboxypeptidase [Alkalihalophilus pseudofirmus OF4]
MNKLLQISIFIVLLLILVFPSTNVFAFSSLQNVYMFEEPYIVEHKGSASLLPGTMLTHNNQSYIPLRDAANLFDLEITSNASGIFLESRTSSSSIHINSSLNHPLPKQTIPSNDFVSFSIPIGAHAGAVLESGQDRPSFTKNANAALYPASTVKVMTALLAIEKGNLSDRVVVGPGAATVPFDSSKAGVRPGDVMTLEQLLHGLMLPSGNDAAVAIAEHIGGSHWQFVQMMNQRARELGATNTTFMNAHGYDHPSQKTTVSDLAKIGAEASKHPEFLKLISTPTYATTYRNRAGSPVHKVWRNTNQMLHNQAYRHSSIIGGKTGYTSVSRHNLISFAEAGGSTYTTVILRGERTQRYYDTTNMLSRAISARQQFDQSNKKQVRVLPLSSSILYNNQPVNLENQAFMYNGTTYIHTDLLSLFSNAVTTASVSSVQQMHAAVNGEIIGFDLTPPVLSSGRMLVPIRAIFDFLELDVHWDASTQTVTGSNRDTVIELRVNQTTAKVNGTTHTLDVPATVVNGRTLVPIRFVAESTGSTIDWGRARVLYLN